MDEETVPADASEGVGESDRALPLLTTTCSFEA